MGRPKRKRAVALIGETNIEVFVAEPGRLNSDMRYQLTRILDEGGWEPDLIVMGEVVAGEELDEMKQAFKQAREELDRAREKWDA